MKYLWNKLELTTESIWVQNEFLLLNLELKLKLINLRNFELRLELKRETLSLNSNVTELSSMRSHLWFEFHTILNQTQDSNLRSWRFSNSMRSHLWWQCYRKFQRIFWANSGTYDNKGCTFFQFSKKVLKYCVPCTCLITARYKNTRP